MKDFFSSLWKSIIKPIGEAFSWMGSSIFTENSPIRKFENNGNVVNKLSKNSIFSNGNPLINNSAVKQFSENSKSNFGNFKVKSVIEEKRAMEQEEVEKAFKKSRCEIGNRKYITKHSIKRLISTLSLKMSAALLMQ